MSIEVRYRNGNMKINLEQFFPTTVTKVKKLKRLIQTEQDGETIINNVAAWLEERIRELESKSTKSEMNKLKKNLEVWKNEDLHSRTNYR